MRKFLLKGFAVLAVAAAMTSCASIGVVGSIYTDTTMPGTVTSNEVGSKVGTSSATSILGLIATGDAGVNSAAKNGNITKVSHVDIKTNSILGLFTKQDTFVYGE